MLLLMVCCCIIFARMKNARKPKRFLILRLGTKPNVTFYVILLHGYAAKRALADLPDHLELMVANMIFLFALSNTTSFLFQFQSIISMHVIVTPINLITNSLSLERIAIDQHISSPQNYVAQEPPFPFGTALSVLS